MNFSCTFSRDINFVRNIDFLTYICVSSSYAKTTAPKCLFLAVKQTSIDATWIAWVLLCLALRYVRLLIHFWMVLLYFVFGQPWQKQEFLYGWDLTLLCLSYGVYVMDINT